MRTRFVAGTAATLRFTPPGAETLGGAILSATVTIRQSNGTDLPTPVVAQAATVTGTELSLALAGAQLVDPLTRSGHLYVADWSYVVGAETLRADQLFEVRRRVLRSTLTEEEVLRYLPARIEELQESASVRDEVADAWDDVLDDVAARGFEPDRIMDCDRLRRPHRSKVLAVLARTWGPNWKDWAEAKATDYARDLDAALNAGDWYESVAEDGIQAATEVKVTSVRLSR